VLEFDKNPFDHICYPGVSRYLNFKGDGDVTSVAPAAHSARQWNIIAHLTGTPMMIPVIEITTINKCFIKMLKRNATFRMSVAAAAAAAAVAGAALAAAASPPMPAPTLSTPVMSPSTTNVIAHIPAHPKPIKKKKPLASIPAHVPAPTLVGDLCLHVARQLMELAQIKKDMCPVIAEEYTAGETAAMPCGHLFSKLAIQESFKKENNKCPACRQNGRPTFV
jgi:hypothetical protein